MADFSVGGRQFKTVRNARHDNYVIDVNVDKPDFAVAIGVAKDRPCAILQHSGKTLKLLRQPGDELASANVRDVKFPCAFTIRNGDHSIEVLSGGKSLLRTMTDGIGKGDIAVCGSASVTSYQRLEHFVFGDDFMRTEEEAKEWGLWTPVRGKWLIHSVMERIQANPDARIREGYIPVPDRSPNPFCIAGATEEGKDAEALILTGQPFWCNYEASVSVRPSVNSEFGLAFSVTDADNLWLLKWSLPSLGMKASGLELVRRSNGKEEVVCGNSFEGRAENWYRLGVSIRDGHVTAYLDKVKVLEADSDFCTGGKIGLFCSGKVECRFDDVDVKSLTDYDLRQLPDSACQTLSGKWQLLREGSTLVAQKNGSRMLLGFRDWDKASIATHVSFEQDGFSLLFAYKDENNYGRALWTPKNKGVARIERVANGSRETLAELPHGIPTHGGVALYHTDDGYVEFRMDGVLVLRAKWTGTEGCCGIEGAKKLQCSGISLFAENLRDWEQPVDVERFRNDPFMQGWASTRYSWIRQGELESFPQTHLFTGDVYGALAIDAPLMPGLSFEFGADNFGEDQSTAFDGWYRVACELDEASGNGRVALFRKKKEVASAGVSGLRKTILEGTQIIDEKIGARPRTPDTPSFGKLSILRDGHVIAVSLDGKELFSFTDPEPRKGRALQTTITNPVDFIHFAVRREKLLDYLFEKAETDWSSIGRWEVTNRFACDPRWSHMNGESHGVASLWSKFNLPSDYTIECFAGMRMRQGELLEGAAMSYPRVGDINLALNGNGRELFSRSNLLIAAWDSKWTEMWTKFMFKDECVFKTDVELIPRGRKRSPGARPIKQVWDPGGRPVHGAWYALKVRRSGSYYTVWFDNYKVGSFKDPDVNSAGRRIALWTQYNSIVIARMKIGYDRLERFAPLPPLNYGAGERPPKPEPRRPLDTDWTPPQDKLAPFAANAANGFKGLFPWNGDQSAELSIVKRRRGKECLLAENVNSGGDFGIRLPFDGCNMRKAGTLSFDCLIPKGTLVNLYVWLKEYPNRKFFVRLSGPKESSPLCTLLRDIDVPSDKWTNVSIDLSSEFAAALPFADTLTCAAMMIGMQHEGYLNAGLGGNAENATYLLDNVALAPLQGNPVASPATAPSDGADWPFSPIVVDFGKSATEVPLLKYCKLACGGNVLSLNYGNCDYDAVNHVLTIKPLFSQLPNESIGQPVKFTFSWKNAVDLKDREISWNAIPKPELDRTPPPPPLVDPSRSMLTCENIAPQCYVSGTDMLTLGRRANGLLEAAVTAKVAAAANTLTMGFHQFRACHFPYLLFDYAIDEEALVDVRLQTIGRRDRYNLGMTDNDNTRNVLRKTMEGVVADGKYHSAKVNLMDFILYKATPDEPSDIRWNTKELNVLDIAFGNFGYRGTAPGSTYRISNVRLAPTLQWSNGATRISWVAPDPGGIKGYSVVVDGEDGTEPPEAISHVATYQDFTDLKEGLQFIHVRACDNNGNWGRAVHAPVFVDKTPVAIASCSVHDGAKAAPDKLTFSFDGKGGLPDLSAMKLFINGIQQNASMSSCSWDQDALAFTFNMLYGTPTHSPIKDGAPFKVELSGIKSSSGIPLPKYTTSWTMDFSQDRKAPAAPSLTALHFNYFESFERTRQTYPQNADAKVVFDETLKSNCLELTYAAGNPATKFVSVRTDVPSLDRSHLLRFKYCIKKGGSLSLMFRKDKRFAAIKLAPNTPGAHIATADGILDDGNWHTVELDLAELVKDRKDIVFSTAYFGVHEGSSAATKVRLDDISMIPDINDACAFTLYAADESGIQSFESKVSEMEDDAPEARSDFKGRHVLPLASTGRKFLHVRARDCAGNASAVLHVPFNATRSLAKVAADGLERLADAVFIDEDGRGYSAALEKCVTADGDTLAFLQFNRNRPQKTLLLFPYRGEKAPKGLSLDLVPMDVSGLKVSMVTIGSIGGRKDLRTAIRNNNVKDKVVSEAVQIDKGNVRRTLNFTPKKPLENPPAYIGLMFEAGSSSRDSFMLDNVVVH
ncbi:MAG: hypothetical protein J5833_01145 [Victivallales bacterium]|nr:hypothetical protein [Victivallales bacterium]